jgi:hypothetical protein
MGEDRFDLPLVHGPKPADDEPTCGPTAYVSLEEKAILEAMRRLRERAEAVREQLEGAGSDAERAGLAAQLDALRAERSELAERREAAYRRKMVMLGHMDPDEVDLR